MVSAVITSGSETTDLSQAEIGGHSFAILPQQSQMKVAAAEALSGTATRRDLNTMAQTGAVCFGNIPLQETIFLARRGLIAEGDIPASFSATTREVVQEVREVLAQGDSLKDGIRLLDKSIPLHPLLHEEKDTVRAKILEALRQAADPAGPICTRLIEECLREHGSEEPLEQAKARVAAAVGKFRMGHFDVAVEEALMNSIEHGNKRNPARSVSVEYGMLAKGTFVVRTQDQGIGFEPENVADPTDSDNLERVNGRGLLLMQSFTHSVRFNEKGNGVELVFNLKQRIAEVLAPHTAKAPRQVDSASSTR